MKEVWVFSLICILQAPDKCGMNDPVMFPPGSYPSKESCYEEGFKFASKVKLPDDRWAVFCFEGKLLPRNKEK